MTKSLESGQVFAARYTLLRRIGHGRSAVVWLAQDHRLQCDVALKFLVSEAAAQPALRERFLRAATLQAGLDHPRLLRCLEVIDDAEHPCAVLEFAAGGDASQLRGRTWRELRPVLLDVATALGALHEHGFVHRDVKTSNVLLDDDGRARLTDFELTLSSGATDASRAGSPLSSSPQQLRGEAATVADDVYGFGALAVELLTGYPPMRAGDGTLEFTLPEGAQAPAAAMTLIRQCLAVDPQRRPPELATVARRLADAVPDVASVVRPAPARQLQAPTVPEAPLQPVWQRGPPEAASAAALRWQGFRRGLLAAGFAVLLLSAAAVFFVLPRWVERRAPVPAATAPPAAPAPAAKNSAQKDLERLAEAKRRAEELQPGVLARLARLDARSAGLWGGERYATGKAAVGDFQRLFADRDYEAALARLQAADGDLAAVEKSQPAKLAATLAAASAALGRGDVAAATAAFELALRIEPGNAAAKRGLERTAVNDRLRARLAEAQRLEEQGDTQGALAAYRSALALDADSALARGGVARLADQASARAFSAAMARALAAQARQDPAAARAAFDEAERLRPGAPEVREGRAQIDRALSDQALTTHLERAVAAEQAERWREALEEYRKTLALDANLLAAQQGVERTEPRAMLDAELTVYLDRPERLFSSEVREAARAALRRAAAIPSPGAGLRAQADRLGAAVTAAETPVRIALASDRLTSVTIYRVGELGAFERRDMDLMPGRYTVVGTRSGYRDVRRELTVLPGRAAATLEIRCEDPI